MTHVSAMHCKHRGSGDDIEWGSSGFYAQNICAFSKMPDCSGAGAMDASMKCS